MKRNRTIHLRVFATAIVTLTVFGAVASMIASEPESLQTEAPALSTVLLFAVLIILIGLASVYLFSEAEQ